MVAAGLAAGMVLSIAALPAPAAGPAQWLLKYEGLWVSERVFRMALSVNKPGGAEGGAASQAEARFRRLRERLLLAVAASKAGLENDPKVRASLDEYRVNHLADLWIEEKIVQTARASAREKTAGAGIVAEEQAFKEERLRLNREAAAAAAREFTVEIDETALKAATEGGDAIVARVAGREVRAAQVAAGAARIRHPSDKPESVLSIAQSVLNGLVDRLRFAALAEREGFGRRPDFIDDYVNRAVYLLAEAYVEQKIRPGVRVEEAEIATEYARVRETLRRGEEREIYEILVPTRSQAEEIAARLAAGADFAAEVAAHSGGATRQKGGFLGYLEAGEIHPALDAAIRTLAPGQISPVVTSPFGYHILRCASVQNGRIPPLEEARPELMRRLLTDHGARSFAEEIERLSREYPLEFNEARYQEILRSL